MLITQIVWFPVCPRVLPPTLESHTWRDADALLLSLSRVDHVRVAAIDVGTNSTRLLVAEARADGFRSVERRMVITRLGQGVDRTGVLASDALKRTLSTIADYAATCGELGVQRIRVTGTS